MYFLSLIVAAATHPSTDQPLCRLFCEHPKQAAHDRPDQAPIGVSNKTPTDSVLDQASKHSTVHEQTHAGSLTDIYILNHITLLHFKVTV